MPLGDATSPPLTTPADLQALRERWQEASPGDWHAYRPHDDWVVRHDFGHVCDQHLDDLVALDGLIRRRLARAKEPTARS